jgi:hypothetical protein
MGTHFLTKTTTEKCAKMLYVIPLLLLSTSGRLHAWTAIVLDGAYAKTQLYIPGNPSVNMPNVNFGLSNLRRQAAVMLNGSAYFIGGGTATNYVAIFDPMTNRSTSSALMNVARYSHAATVVGDTIIVCGGCNQSNCTASCEQFTLAANEWNMITSLPAPTSSFVMATLNNRVYTFGGSAACGSAPPVYMFDGQNWVSRSSIASLPNQDHAGVAIDTDRALICGGQASDSCQTVSDCFIYSALSNNWTNAASMAQIRSDHTMVIFEGNLSQYFALSCTVNVKQIKTFVTT